MKNISNIPSSQDNITMAKANGYLYLNNFIINKPTSFFISDQVIISVGMGYIGKTASDYIPALIIIADGLNNTYGQYFDGDNWFPIQSNSDVKVLSFTYFDIGVRASKQTFEIKFKDGSPMAYVTFSSNSNLLVTLPPSIPNPASEPIAGALNYGCNADIISKYFIEIDKLASDSVNKYVSR